MQARGGGDCVRKAKHIRNTALEGGRWSTPRSGRFVSGKKGTYCAGGWVGLGPRVDDTERLAPTGIRSPYCANHGKLLIPTELFRPPFMICTSFFLILTYCYIIVVGAEGYCYSLSHSPIHTHWHSYTHSLRLFCREIGPSPRPVHVQHRTLTTDRHPYPQRLSNPQFQQASGRRPTP
jgi:hypothetical protein